ncbi:phytoene/squalene synthase family protein [Neobacillus sp. PS2-9]|uniref:phytoene/squalene synthase family protein n=1 Tax=Neobacillus sp. PS2-9 TaxID=3070676 RepID=UPI0027E1B99E|nr:phytoene/squalene synthase family protein [Neobacillus sp. PS2-9]WML56725.1 phytoene/squalene synthase family protein [Neobacillus sp. PS2-9]
MIDSNLISACEELMKKHSASFYTAFRFLPSPRKEAVFVIYAFCRMIDDSVDEPESSPYTLSELETLFDHLDSAEGHFIWPCLSWLFSSFPISKEPFYKQISGQKMDTTLTNYETMEELELYCERVAGSVGEMLLPVLHDQPSSEVELAGVYLGKAMQIVNIIRDIGEDQQKGRRYIPKEWMEQYHYTQEEFETNVVNFRFKRMLTGLMNVAEDWFSKGLENIDTYPEKSSFSIKLAAGYYAAIMEAVRHNEYQVYTSRAIVSDKKKKMILLAALQVSSQNEVHSIEA